MTRWVSNSNLRLFFFPSQRFHATPNVVKGGMEKMGGTGEMGAMERMVKVAVFQKFNKPWKRIGKNVLGTTLMMIRTTV